MISQNVIEETYTALENHKDLFDAADELGISEQGLRYRIKSYPKLMELAIRRGLYEPMKKAAHALPDPPRIPKHPDPEPKAAVAPVREEPKPSPNSKNKPGFHRMDIQVPDDVYSDLVKMAELDMRPVNIQAVWLLKRVLAPIGTKEV
jgi:hypothetical protein